MMALPNFAFIGKIRSGSRKLLFSRSSNNCSIPNAVQSLITIDKMKNISNKGLLVFIIVFFPVMTVINYFFLYDSDINQSLLHSVLSTLIGLLIFVVKRKWDRKQANDFKKQIAMKKTILFSILIIVVSIMAIFFIKDSNDHKECSHIQETKILSNGTTVVSTNKHVCKEKFNF